MIKASYLQKQATKYRELARAEVSLEMRRQLFALAARCDELAATMARWPGPKDIARAAPAKKEPLEPALSAATVQFPDRFQGRRVNGLER
ncbi:MAG TPA: hypothetical protein VGB82_07305 [Alphaproteobacteria bacterium]